MTIHIRACHYLKIGEIENPILRVFLHILTMMQTALLLPFDY